jgi:MYXO-CTERM domain-containing protein
VIPPKDDDDSGCAMAPQRSSWSFAGVSALALLALGAARRRSKR